MQPGWLARCAPGWWNKMERVGAVFPHGSYFHGGTFIAAFLRSSSAFHRTVSGSAMCSGNLLSVLLIPEDGGLAG